MLGAEAATELTDHVVEGAFDSGLASEKGIPVRAWSLVEVEMQVTVADVAVDDQSAVRNIRAYPGGGALHKIGERRDRYRDVVFETRPVDTLGFWNGLAQLPERGAFTLATRQRRIQHEAVLERACQCFLHERVEWIRGTRGGQLAE